MFPFTIWSFLWFNQHTSNMMLQKFKIIFASSTHEWIANFHPRLIFHLHEMFTQREWFLQSIRKPNRNLYWVCNFRLSIGFHFTLWFDVGYVCQLCNSLWATLSIKLPIHHPRSCANNKIRFNMKSFNVDFVVNESEYLQCHRDEFSVV